MEGYERSYSFSIIGLNTLWETVDDARFLKQDAEEIMAALKDQMRVVPFCEYLKRYVYLRSGTVGSYRSIPEEEYRDTICDAFYATGTPVSMKKMTTRVPVRIASWLQQESARRSAVLLLGFGLSMSVQDVNDFMMKALHDHALDMDDPVEAICSYCYERQYGFLKMRQLMQVLKEAEEGAPLKQLIERNQPAEREASRKVATEDEKLIQSILDGKKKENPDSQMARTRRHFQELLSRALASIHREQPICNGMNHEKEKNEAAAGAIQDVLYASIPKEKHGNLLAEVHSSLTKVIAGKRLSRQRLSRLMRREEEPTRYDLMTLLFLIFAREQADTGRKERFVRYYEETGGILDDCGYGPMYTAAPYECFLMMCMLSVDPLGTFSDVLEMSYQREEDGADA